MNRIQDVIPPEPFREIQQYIREKANLAKEGYDSASADEDSLTGDFGGILRTSGWRASHDGTQLWRWRVNYKKIRGRGNNAPEKIYGADGIFIIEVHSKDEPRIFIKSFIFQAKKSTGSSRSELMAQVNKMESFAPGGSAVIEFSGTGYTASPSGSILSQAERKQNRIPHAKDPLDHFLADNFLACKTGLMGMYYDAVREKLIVPLAEGGDYIISMKIPNRIEIRVTNDPQDR